MAESKLTDLIAKLEAATEGSRELDLDIAQLLREPWGYTGGETPRDIKCAPITTSLDAIVALIERKLPTMADFYIAQHRGSARATIWLDGKPYDGVKAGRYKPLAACIALLSALQLQGGSEQ